MRTCINNDEPTDAESLPGRRQRGLRGFPRDSCPTANQKPSAHVNEACDYPLVRWDVKRPTPRPNGFRSTQTIETCNLFMHGGKDKRFSRGPEDLMQVCICGIASLVTGGLHFHSMKHPRG